MDRQFVGAARVWMCAMGLMMGCPAQSSGPGGPGNDAGQVTPENDTGPATSDTGAPFPVDSGSMTNPEAGPDPLLDAGCDTTVPVEVEVIGDPPDMMLIVDASGSMITPLDLFNPLVSKWQVMSDALKGLVTTHNRRINFGLMTYPGTGECGTGIVRADIAPMNAMTIHSMLDAHGPGLNGATPTAPAVDATREYYMARTPNPIGRYAVLATDGLPNCGPRDMEGNYTGTSDETVTAIQALAAAGIPVYVIGFGSFLAADTTTLMRMATAGGTGMFYQASSPQSLAMALESIAAEVVQPSCDFALTGPERNPMLLRVDLDGTLVPRNQARTSGWDYEPATNVIHFYGDECTRIQSGQVQSINVDFGCPGPLI